MTRLALLFVLACSAACDSTDWSNEDVVPFTVPAGATLSAVADSLHARGLIASPRLFRFLATISGRSRAVRAGVFDVPRNANAREVLHLLVSGPPALRTLVVQEGMMLTEIAARVEQQLGIPAEEVVGAAHDDSLRTALRVPEITLEGYLYPSTYLVRADAGARAVVRQMAEEFSGRWKPAWDTEAEALGLTPAEVVILASIIEGEVRHDADRRYVSSVYHNRLRRGMRLQADPTVIYALGRRRRLFERDYDVISPYNTYRIHGLPPGPIGSPSTASIEAALSPAPSPFLYFVANEDGAHVFSRTYAEHLSAIRRIRSRGRRGGATGTDTGR
jgi:UPF0755 protein